MVENTLKTAIIEDDLDSFESILTSSQCFQVPVGSSLATRDAIQSMYSRILYCIVEYGRLGCMDMLLAKVRFVPCIQYDMKTLKLALAKDHVYMLHKLQPFFPEIPVSSEPVSSGQKSRSGISGNIDTFTTSELLSKLHVWDIDHNIITNIDLATVPRRIYNFSTLNGHLIPNIDYTIEDLEHHTEDLFLPGVAEQDLETSIHKSKLVIQEEIQYNNLKLDDINNIHQVKLSEDNWMVHCFDVKPIHHSMFYGCYTSPLPFSCVVLDLDNNNNNNVSINNNTNNNNTNTSKISLTEHIYDQRSYHIKTPEVATIQDYNRVLSSQSALRTASATSLLSTQSTHKIQIRPSSCVSLFNPNSKPYNYTKQHTVCLSNAAQSTLASFTSLYTSSFIAGIQKHHAFTCVKPEEYLTRENQYHVQNHEEREQFKYRSRRKLVIKDQTLDTPFLVTRRSSHHTVGNVGKDLIIDLCNFNTEGSHWANKTSTSPINSPISLDLNTPLNYSMYDSYDEENDLGLIRVLGPEAAPIVDRQYSSVEKTGISRLTSSMLKTEQKEVQENLFKTQNYSFTQLLKRDQTDTPITTSKQPRPYAPIDSRPMNLPIPLKHTLKPFDQCSVAQELLQLSAVPYKVVGAQYYKWNNGVKKDANNIMIKDKYTKVYYTSNRPFQCLSVSALFGEQVTTTSTNTHLCALPFSRQCVDLPPDLHIHTSEHHFPTSQTSYTHLSPPSSLGDALVTQEWLTFFFTKFLDPPAAKRLSASLFGMASQAKHTMYIEQVRSTIKTTKSNMQNSQLQYTKSMTAPLDLFLNTGVKAPEKPTHTFHTVELVSFPRIMTYLVQAQTCSVLHLLITLNTLYTLNLVFIAKVGLLHTEFRPTDRSPLLHTISALALSPATNISLYLQKVFQTKLSATTLGKWLAPLMGTSSANTVSKSLSEVAMQLISSYKAPTKTPTLKWLITAFLFDKTTSDKQYGLEGKTIKVVCPPL